MIILGAVFRVAEAASLPIVDLGYELHQASSFSVSKVPGNICCDLLKAPYIDRFPE